MANFFDTFTEVGDILLHLHTPDIGPGWVRGVTGEDVVIIGGAGYARADQVTGLNRYDPDMVLGPNGDYYGDFEYISGAVRYVYHFARQTAKAAGDGTYFGYNFDAGKYEMAGASDVAEAWPGGIVELHLEVRPGVANGYVNGVLKITSTTDANPTTGLYAGIMMTDYNGSSPSTAPRIYEYEATIYAAAAIIPSFRDFPKYQFAERATGVL